jgi:type VI protein secretion system component VasK
MPSSPDPLDPLLDQWSGTPDPSPQMAAEVWQRIAAAEAESLNGTGAWATINAWFSRPPFAVMFVASCALLGLFLAEVRVNRQQRERSTQLARSYVQLIDPLIRSDLVARNR